MNFRSCAIIGRMRPKGTDEQLAARRERALALLREGKRPIDVAANGGVSDRSIRRWRAEASQSRRRRVPRAGRHD